MVIIETRNAVTPENVQMLERVIDDLKHEITSLQAQLDEERNHHEWAKILKEESVKIAEEYEALLEKAKCREQDFQNLWQKHYKLVADLLTVMNDMVELKTVECRNIICRALIQRLKLEHKT